MKLKELRRKKTIIALIIVVFSAVDISIAWNAHDLRYWDLINSVLPNWFLLPMEEIVLVAILGLFLGQDKREKVKLTLLGLVLAFITVWITILCQFLATDIPILK